MPFVGFTDKTKMRDAEFIKMEEALRSSLRRYPHCTIANCECNSRLGEWKPGCFCMCHFFHMDIRYGKGKWKLADFNRQAREGFVESGEPKERD